jgi:uncharacterized protein YraI
MIRVGWAAQRSTLAALLVALGLGLLVIGALACVASPAMAQSDGPPVGSVLRVANTDGQRLNVRAAPSTDQPIVGRLPAGETLTVTGASRTIGITRWVPVTTSAGQPGWVSAEFVVSIGSPAPTITAVAETAPTPPLIGSASGGPTAQTEHDSRSESRGKPLEVEAKLKFPEVKGREQEITVWVTRGGVPIPGAVVTLESSDGEDGERFRELDPTNDEGRTRRAFDVRREKGTVEIQVEAVAPDGGEGRTIVSYFRR